MKKTPQVERTNSKPQMPPLPPWPTSRPGPGITEPPAGQRRVRSRTDQVVEVEYDTVQGKSTARS